MDSKTSIDRCRKSQRSLDIAKEKKILRKGPEIERRRDKQEAMKSDRSFLKKNLKVKAVHNIPLQALKEKSNPISDTPILSPETSIALDNAEKIMQNALLEIKQLNVAQSRNRKGGIRLRVHELSLEDEYDQLLYVRERVAAKLHDIDSGIGPAEDSRRIKVDGRFLRDFATNAERFAMKHGLLDKTDGKSLDSAPREPAAGDNVPTSNSKKLGMDESRGVTDRLSGTSGQRVQRKMEGFSIHTGTSVNIQRELKAQKLQDIHISPDPSFVLDAPNIATYKFEYGTKSRKDVPKTRVKMIRIEKEGNHISERINDEPKEFQVDDEKISIDLNPVPKNIESEHSEISNTNIDIIPDESRLSGVCINKQVVHSPEKERIEKRDDTNLDTVQKNNVQLNYSTELASKDRIKKSNSNKVNYFRDRETENDIRERERHKAIEIHFNNILENYSDRNNCLIDTSLEDVPTLEKVDLYQPSMTELDTVITAYNKTIKRIVRGVRSVEQFLSDNKVAKYRSKGNQILDQCIRDNLLVSNQSSRIPLNLSKQRKIMCHNLTHKQMEVSRNNVWPTKVMKRRQPKTREVEHKFIPCKTNYGSTDLLRGTNNPKRQLRRNDRLLTERSMKFHFNESHECFTENINQPMIDIANASGSNSESIYTDDDYLKIQSMSKVKADATVSRLKSPNHSKFKDSEENHEYQGILRELEMKMKDSTRTIEHFRTSFQNIESENVKRLLESELKRKEIDPKMIRSVIKNLEEYVKDLKDLNDASVASKTVSKNDCENTLTVENNSQVLSEIEQECNTIEKELNESRATQSLHSENINNPVKTIMEENVCNKIDHENKENNSGKSVSSSSRKKTLSLPIHESSRLDNKAERLVTSDVKSLEEISFIKPSDRSSIVRNSSVQKSKISLPKTVLDSGEMKISRSARNSDQIKNLSSQDKIVNKTEENDLIRQKSSSILEAGEQVSSADSLRDCPSLSPSIDDKQPSPKSSSQILPSLSIKSKSIHQSEKTNSQNKLAECPVSEILSQSQPIVSGNKLQQPSEEKSIQVDIINEKPYKTHSLSEASHSEGEICLSSCCSFSLGEVRRINSNSYITNSKTNFIENDIIFVARPVQTWNVSTDSQSESPGEF